jgi:short-subunit dehydrogenase
MKALITGASSGIGREIAKYLDSLGYNTILVARREDRLKELSKELKNQSEILKLDVSKLEDVYDLIDITKDEDIDILINNAGFGLFGEFDKTDLNRELEMIDVNIKAVHILTKEFIIRMKKKNKGYILNVASSAGFLAGPNLSTYYATKNYVLRLTEAINEELRQNKSKVQISALCPGPVDTEFNKVAKGTFSTKPLTPEYVAKYAIDSMFKRKMIIIPGRILRICKFFMRFLPERILLNYIYNYQKSKITKNKSDN